MGPVPSACAMFDAERYSIVGVGGRGQQPAMNRRSCNYSGGPGSPRPELNNMTHFNMLQGWGKGWGGGVGGGEGDNNYI